MRHLLGLTIAVLALTAGVALAQSAPPQGSPPQGSPPQGSPPQGSPPQSSPPQSSPSPNSPPITVTVHPKVTPNKAGTPDHPQGVHLSVGIDIGIPEGYNPPLLNEIDVWFPRGGLYNGDLYPTCSAQILNRAGPTGCPNGAIMGSGSGVARADTTFTYPKITVVNGGQHVVYFYTVLNNPARVQEPVAGIVTKLSGPWSYKLHVVIPQSLQIVAGVPIVVHSLQVAGGNGNWIATTYCPPDHEWKWKGEAIFSNGQTLFANGQVGCRS